MARRPVSTADVATGPRLIAGLYVASVLVVSVQRGAFAFANDFAIFRAASWNLLAGADLYVLRPEQALDLYKYSPTFALLFLPIAVLPPFAGLVAWNLLGALALHAALRHLLPVRESMLALLMVYLAMLRNVQSAQSNALVAALIVMVFSAIERHQWWRAASAVGIGAAIKVFPIAAVLLGITRRGKGRFAVSLLVVGVALVLAPLGVTDPRSLAAQYASWRQLHATQRVDLGLSAMALVLNGLHASWPQWWLQATGSVMLLLPFLLARQREEASRSLRLQLLASVLVFVVIFNHKAEAQSYVIAITGVTVWWASRPGERWRLGVALLVIAFTNLPSTDIVPTAVKAAIPALWRGALPCSLLWLVQQGELLYRLSGRAREHPVIAETGHLHGAGV